MSDELNKKNDQGDPAYRPKTNRELILYYEAYNLGLTAGINGAKEAILQVAAEELGSAQLRNSVTVLVNYGVSRAEEARTEVDGKIKDLTAQSQAADPAQRLRELADLANETGASGIFIIRDICNASVMFSNGEDAAAVDAALAAQDMDALKRLVFQLEIADGHTLVVMRFPTGDGGPAGIESR